MIVAELSHIRPVYLGVFLDEESRTRLLERVWPIHPNVFADHMTLIYKPIPAQVTGIATRMSLRVRSVSWDDRGQAVRVDGGHALVEWDRIPHITISCAHGTRPVYSNQLLQRGADLVEPFYLTGVIDTFPRSLT